MGSELLHLQRDQENGENANLNLVTSPEEGMNTLGTAHLRRVRTLEFSDLRAGDVILIRTRNNLYSFSVANERTLCGRLLSEVNKSQFRDAVLVGAFAKVLYRLVRRSGRIILRLLIAVRVCTTANRVFF